MIQMRILVIVSILFVSRFVSGQTSYDDFYQKGLDHLKNADYKSALGDFQKILVVKNDHKDCADAFERISYCYYGMNEFVRSLHYIDKVLQIDKSNIGARFTRAQIFQRQKNKELALKEYDTLTNIAKDNGIIYYERAVLY